MLFDGTVSVSAVSGTSQALLIAVVSAVTATRAVMLSCCEVPAWSVSIVHRRVAGS